MKSLKLSTTVLKALLLCVFIHAGCPLEDDGEAKVCFDNDDNEETCEVLNLDSLEETFDIPVPECSCDFYDVCEMGCEACDPECGPGVESICACNESDGCDVNCAHCDEDC